LCLSSSLPTRRLLPERRIRRIRTLPIVRIELRKPKRDGKQRHPSPEIGTRYPGSGKLFTQAPSTSFTGFHQEPHSDILEGRSGPAWSWLGGTTGLSGRSKPLGGASAKEHGCFVGSTMTAGWSARREETGVLKRRVGHSR
jgi:hypothetical protein